MIVFRSVAHGPTTLEGRIVHRVLDKPKRLGYNTLVVTIRTTDAEIDAAIARVRTQENERPRAVEAHYNRADDKFFIALAPCVAIVIPRAYLQGLENASPAQAAEVELDEVGSGLHWPALDVDHYIPGILAGVLGTRRWMSELGRKGGIVRSAAKTAAGRANGLKGGRPQRSTRAVAGSALAVQRRSKRRTRVAARRLRSRSR